MIVAMAWYSLANQIVKSNPLLLHLSSTFAITVWTKLNRLTPFVLWTLNLCLATQNTHGIYKRPGACKLQTDPLHLSVSSISYQLFIKVGRLHLLKGNKICKFFIDKVVGRFVLRGNAMNFVELQQLQLNSVELQVLNTLNYKLSHNALIGIHRI